MIDISQHIVVRTSNISIKKIMFFKIYLRFSSRQMIDNCQHIVVRTSNPAPLQHEKGWETNSVGRLFRFDLFLIHDFITMMKLSSQ